MKILNNKVILLLSFLSIIIIYYLSSNKTVEKSKKKDRKFEILDTQEFEKSNTDIIKTENFVLYNNKINKNIDFKRRYEFLRNINDEKKKRKEDEKNIEKEKKQIAYQNYIKNLKSQTEKLAKSEKSEIEENSEWVRDTEEISDDEKYLNLPEEKISDKSEDIKSDLSELINNYPKFDKRYSDIYSDNNEITLLTNL